MYLTGKIYSYIWPKLKIRIYLSFESMSSTRVLLCFTQEKRKSDIGELV
jgi:hypothetical protein